MGQPNDDQTQQLILLNTADDLAALLRLATVVVPTEDFPFIAVNFGETDCDITPLSTEVAARYAAQCGLCPQHLTASGYFVNHGYYSEYVRITEGAQSVVKEIRYFPPWLAQAVCRRLFTSTPAIHTDILDGGSVAVNAVWDFETDSERVTVIVDLYRQSNRVKIERRIPRVTNTIVVG